MSEISVWYPFASFLLYLTVNCIYLLYFKKILFVLAILNVQQLLYMYIKLNYGFTSVYFNNKKLNHHYCSVLKPVNFIFSRGSN